MVTTKNNQDGADMVSDTASQRLLHLREASLNDHDSRSSRADDGTFHRAHSHQEQAPSLVSGPGLGSRAALGPDLHESSRHVSLREIVTSATLSETKASQCNSPNLHLDGRGWGDRLKTLRDIDKHNLSLVRQPLPRLRRYPRCQLQLAQSWAAFMTVGVVSCEGSVARMRVTFEGPPQSPYKNGIFHLGFLIGEDFALKPPECKFLTRVYHPNVDHTGYICLDILGNKWSTALHISTTITSIISTLDDATLEDPLGA
jgi:ubiquitin-protein ligase